MIRVVESSNRPKAGLGHVTIKSDSFPSKLRNEIFPSNSRI